METPSELLEHLRAHEGCVLHPYLDPAGVPTIGYGHVIPSMDVAAISQDTAESLLRLDVRRARRQLLKASPAVVNATPRRQHALIDFVFNLGIGRYRRSTLRKAVERDDWPEAGKQMRRWVYARVNGTPVRLKGLVARREVCARWLEEG